MVRLYEVAQKSYGLFSNGKQNWPHKTVPNSMMRHIYKWRHKTACVFPWIYNDH